MIPQRRRQQQQQQQRRLNFNYIFNFKNPLLGEATHDDEAVARVVFRDIVAHKLSEIRTDYIAESRRLLAANRSSDVQANVRAVAAHVANESDADDSDNEGHYQETDDESEAVQGSAALNASETFAAEPHVVRQLIPDEQPLQHRPDHHFGPTLQRLSEVDTLRREAAFQDRFVLMIDGCNPQRQAMCGKPGAEYKGVIHECISPEGHDVGKCSPECTMGQNPNDACRCHCQLKAYVKKKMKWSRRNHSDAMKVFIEQSVLTAGLDKGSLNTVLLFCGHLEQMICRVWLPDNIRSGWKKIGLISDHDPSGIDLKLVLSGWIGAKDISQENLNATVAKLPVLAREIVATTTVSDASMEQLQQYYPKPWIHYKTDRSKLTTSRARASILVADFESHQMRFLDEDRKAAAARAGNVRAAAAALPDPPREHGYKDPANTTETADRICSCKVAQFAGARTYKNTPLGWKNHQSTKAHLNWLSGKDKTREEVIGAGEFVPFASHPFAQRPNCAEICRIAAELCLSFDVAAKMEEFAQTVPIDDKDLPMFAGMRPEMMMQKFGIQHALAEQFSELANFDIATAASFQRCNVMMQSISQFAHLYQRSSTAAVHVMDQNNPSAASRVLPSE